MPLTLWDLQQLAVRGRRHPKTPRRLPHPQHPGTARQPPPLPPLVHLPARPLLQPPPPRLQGGSPFPPHRTAPLSNALRSRTPGWWRLMLSGVVVAALEPQPANDTPPTPQQRAPPLSAEDPLLRLREPLLESSAQALGPPCPWRPGRPRTPRGPQHPRLREPAPCPRDWRHRVHPPRFQSLLCPRAQGLALTLGAVPLRPLQHLAKLRGASAGPRSAGLRSLGQRSAGRLLGA
mmetsp:Transcript_23083/g.43390  ORF Transcript_23083/g.43390 Transcript_23083/m.43390 type:complete len:234 (-) Transcript_23083:366-1067(-)